MRESSAPKRPVLDLPSESVAEEEPFELNEGLSADPEPQPTPAPEPAAQPAPAAAQADALDLTDEADGEEAARPLGLSPASSGSDSGEGDEGYDDVDDIVDPLAGLRNEHTERFDAQDDDGVPPPAEDREFGGSAPTEGGWSEDRPPLDLSGGMREDSAAPQDEFELGDEHLANDSPLATKPGRKQPVLPGEGGSDGNAPGGGQGGGSGSLPGNTLFERMANLSRGASPSESERDEDDGDDEGESSSGGLNIPRFLGRQNNQ
jgi:cell division protein FtsZ